MIAMYDLDDNLIRIFDNYKECAKYFHTNPRSIQSCMSKCRHGKSDKKRDGDRWVRLYRIENE